jgi:hypothetical protein
MLDAEEDYAEPLQHDFFDPVEDRAVRAPASHSHTHASRRHGALPPGKAVRSQTMRLPGRTAHADAARYCQSRAGSHKRCARWVGVQAKPMRCCLALQVNLDLGRLWVGRGRTLRGLCMSALQRGG